jgi:hypothetical protein
MHEVVQDWYANFVNVDQVRWFVLCCVVLCRAFVLYVGVRLCLLSSSSIGTV